jgi:hypothetical protein
MNIDIIEEIKKAKNDNSYIKNTIEYLKQQEEETKKHLYLFNVLNLTQEFEQMINSKNFEKSRVRTAEINISVKEDIGNIINIACYNDENMYVDDCYYSKDSGLIDVPEIVTINALFSTLDGLSRDYVGDELRGNKICTLNIKEGCSKIILDLLLSNELKTLLAYAEMQDDLSNKNEANSKKMKM